MPDKVIGEGKKTCGVCGTRFDPVERSSDPAEEMGRFLAREHYGDDGELCRVCLASRGRLGMMYHRELD